jgi:hypothetical protein
MGAIQQLLDRLEATSLTTLSSPASFGVAASLTTVLILFLLWRSRPKPHGLPVVKVTSNNVVGFLAEGAEKVRCWIYADFAMLLLTKG